MHITNCISHELNLLVLSEDPNPEILYTYQIEPLNSGPAVLEDIYKQLGCRGGDAAILPLQTDIQIAAMLALTVAKLNGMSDHVYSLTENAIGIYNNSAVRMFHDSENEIFGLQILTGLVKEFSPRSVGDWFSIQKHEITKLDEYSLEALPGEAARIPETGSAESDNINSILPAFQEFLLAINANEIKLLEFELRR